MFPRFFVPTADTIGSVIDLPDEEAGHLTRVLRLRPGADVLVFDGRGREWRATVDQVTKSRAAVRLVTVNTPAPEPRVAIALAIAVLKGDKTDDVIRDAVMLGAATVQPLLTDRTETRAAVVDTRLERWRRVAVSSAKQCGRAVVPDIRAAATLDEMLAAPRSDVRVTLVEPRSATADARRLRELPRPARAELYIGPEGGWTDRELRALAVTSMLLTLGSQTLRADAMPLVAMTAVRVAWDDF
jgi:16S rRNA (uracil1498-N3)-methyltransferase